MARFVMQESPLESLEKQLPNVIIFIILVLALLVVLTKFGWIHCSQVPGVDWCSTYCAYVVQGKSRVAVLYGQDGLGDPLLLRARLSKLRGFTLVEPLQAQELSAGILRNYDLIIAEHFRTASTRQVSALQGYLDGGGTMVWVGDSFSNQYIDKYDLLLAQQKNDTYYSDLIAHNVTPNSSAWNKAWDAVKSLTWYKYLYNQSKVYGFDVLAGYLHARYDGPVTGQNPVMRVINVDHLLMKGLVAEHGILSTQFAKVVPDASGTDILAEVVTPNDTYPGIIETRYTGKIVYVAFPLEEANSTLFLENVLDYLAPC